MNHIFLTQSISIVSQNPSTIKLVKSDKYQGPISASMLLKIAQTIANQKNGIYFLK
jgi:hypothetical protein